MGVDRYFERVAEERRKDIDEEIREATRDLKRRNRELEDISSQLYQTCIELWCLIEDHGSPTMKAHATILLKAFDIIKSFESEISK